MVETSHINLVVVIKLLHLAERKCLGISERTLGHDAIQNSNGIVNSWTLHIAWRTVPYGYWKNSKKAAMKQ